MTRVLKWIAGFAVYSFFLLLIGLEVPLQMMWYLLAGWALFLIGNAREVTFSPGGAATAAVALVLFIACLHWLLTWFYAESEGTVESTDTTESARPKSWRFAWTLGITGIVVLMFVAGTAMIGVTHQVVWMVTSQERIVSNTWGEVAPRHSSQNNLKQIGVGLLNLEDKEQALPAGATSDAHGRLLHGWQTAILPEMEEGPLYQQIDHSRPWNDPANREVFKTHVLGYIYPAREPVPMHDADGYAISTYAGNVHVLGGTRRWKLDEITDGASKTILTGEAKSEFKPWGSPTNWRDPQDGLNKSPRGFGGPWRGGIVTFGMADGSVQALHEDIDPAVLKALSTPTGGEDLREAAY